MGAGDQFADLLFDQPRMALAGQQIGMAQQVLQEGEIGRRASDAELAQSAIGFGGYGGQRSLAGMHDQLGQQRIETRAGAIAGVAEAVDAHAGTGWRIERRQRTAARPH
jgi:hypothetical protein